MFEKLLREIQALQGARVELSVPIDEDGYLDRECPDSACLFGFKILAEDWTSIVRDEEVFCPMCRHSAPADQWFPQEQINHLNQQAVQHIQNRLGDAMRQDASAVNSRNRPGQFVSLTMRVDGPPQRMLVPLTATEPMRLKAACEACGCHYSYVGSAFFCPSCGHNSAVETFRSSLEAIASTMRAIARLRETLSADEAEITSRFLREKAVSDLVTLIQRLGERLYDGVGGLPPYKRGAFQRLDEASQLWERATGSNFWSFLDEADQGRLRLYYQRRHLLAHCQGMVDQDYVEKSCDQGYRVGQRIVVDDATVSEFSRIICLLGEGMIASISSRPE